MGKSQKAPAAPDPKETAAAQTGTNVSTALANAQLQNINQVTPDGTLTYTKGENTTFRDPTSGAVYQIPQYTATTSLSQQQQAIKDQNDSASLNLAKTANNASGFLTDYLGKGVDTSSIPAQQYGAGATGPIATGIKPAGDITKTYNTDFSADRQRVEDALFSRASPQIDRDRSSLETSLANQGIRVGSTAWSSAMDDFNRGVSDQRTSILLGAGQEQSRLVGLEAQRAGFENSAQQQQYGQNASDAAFQNSAQQQQFGQGITSAQTNNQARESAIAQAYAARNQPINEITALMNGAQVQSPNFVSTSSPQIPTVDYAGLVNTNYQNQMSAWQNQQAQQQSTLGGLFGVGASLIGMSDRRLKTDIVPVGVGPMGLAIYAFRYVWGGPRRIGFMAQDVARVMPDAVVRMANGFFAVDYGKVFRQGGA